MSLIDLFRPAPKPVEDPAVELLQEALADLELSMEDQGWRRLGAEADKEFSREGLARAAKSARIFAVANPLIKRGLAVRQAYVHGQGVEIRAHADGTEDGQQDVNAVVQAWWNDSRNRNGVTGPQAHETLERALGTDGNVFIASFTDPRTGNVQLRTIPFDDMQEVLSNPEDRTEPWYYLRRWTAERVVDGQRRTEQMAAYYPALSYFPGSRPQTIGGIEVRWDSPVYHVKVNALDSWTFGIGDAYSVLPWARAHRDFLSDWAILMKSLSQFAWKSTGGSRSKSQALRDKIARRSAPMPGNENTVGATVLLPEDTSFEAIPKSGAVIDSESGRPLATMVAAGLEVPVTTLLSDPGQTGARAVAETLNLPTRLAMQQRQSVWTEAYRALAEHAIRAAVRAPAGPLHGTITRDRFSDREVIHIAGDQNADDLVVEAIWPDLTDTAMNDLIDAIKTADDTGKMPPLETLRLLLAALGVRNAEDIIRKATDEDGNLIDQDASAGRVAVRAFRRGQDPASALGYGVPAETGE